MKMKRRSHTARAQPSSLGSSRDRTVRVPVPSFRTRPGVSRDDRRTFESAGESRRATTKTRARVARFNLSSSRRRRRRRRRAARVRVVVRTRGSLVRVLKPRLLLTPLYAHRDVTRRAECGWTREFPRRARACAFKFARRGIDREVRGRVNTRGGIVV